MYWYTPYAVIASLSKYMYVTASVGVCSIVKKTYVVLPFYSPSTQCTSIFENPVSIFIDLSDGPFCQDFEHL